MNVAKKHYGLRYVLAGVALGASMILAPGAHAQTTWGPLVIGPGETVVIGPGVERRHTGNIRVWGGGRLEVNGGKLFLTGSLFIDGFLSQVVFDAGELHLAGNYTNIEIDDGRLAFANGGVLHYVQTYVAQHMLEATGWGRVELEGTRVEADEATITVRLHDNASYTATRAYSPMGDSSTWYMWDHSRLELDRVFNGGDIVFYDAVTIDVRDTVGIMPWFYFPEGSVADLVFPGSCTTPDCPGVSMTIDPTVVPGIEWTARIANSKFVAWGFNSYPGSSLTVRDSALAMGMVRLGGSRAYDIRGDFVNGTRYDDETFERLHDRTLRLVNSSVQWWKVDVIEQARARIDGIRFAEMMIKGNARAYVTNSVCEGQTIHLGAIEDGYVYFQDGEVWTHVSAWGRATMVLDRTLVDWTLGQFPYQSRNIAHGLARLSAVNSELRSPPEAMDGAIVTFARLGAFTQPQLETTAATWTPISGSAWIVTGPASGVTFDRWVLAIRAAGADSWTNFGSGTTEVRDAGLAWLAPWLIPQPGEYEVRLTLFVRGDAPLTPHPTWAFPAVKKLVVR